MTGHGGPDAVDGVDDAGDHAEGQQIPHTLTQDVALGAEHPASLDEEVDDLADEHGNHVGCEVGDAALLRAVADDVPLKLNAEQGQVDAGETKVPAAEVRKGRRQEGQQQVLEYGDGVADDDEQAALPDPLGKRGMLLGKIAPPGFDCVHVMRPPC